jgi:hypothetical protein
VRSLRTWPLVALIVVSTGLAAGTTGCGREQARVPVPAFDRVAERTAAYSTVLETVYRDNRTRQFVVGTTLLPGAPISPAADLVWVRSTLGKSQQILHDCVVDEPPDSLGAGAATVADWRAHLSPSPTPRTIQTALPVRWISVAEWNAFFDPAGDLMQQWARVQSEFPDSSGRITLSDVGFSPSGDEALLYTSRMRGGRDGFDAWVLLKRSEGRWSVAKTVYVSYS